MAQIGWIDLMQLLVANHYEIAQDVPELIFPSACEEIYLLFMRTKHV